MPELTRAMIERLPNAGPTDPIAYYRRPLVGRLYLERINMGLRLLGGQRFDRVLEIGYGAGAVLLAIAAVAKDVYGLDLDADPAAVGDVLGQRGCQATLARGDVRSLPYADAFFDLVISFSVFEHLHEYRQALREVARTLRSGGRFLLGMPAVNRTMSLGFRAIGFKGIDHHHVTTPAEVARAFNDCGLRVVEERYLGPRWAPMYSTWLMTKYD